MSILTSFPVGLALNPSVTPTVVRRSRFPTNPAGHVHQSLGFVLEAFLEYLRTISSFSILRISWVLSRLNIMHRWHSDGCASGLVCWGIRKSLLRFFLFYVNSLN